MKVGMSQKNRSEKCFEEREVMKKALISPQIEAYENTNIFSHNLEKQVVSLGKLSKKKQQRNIWNFPYVG